MMKKVLLIAAFAALAFTQSSGAFSPVNLDTLLSKNDETFIKAESFARQAFESRFNGSLGKLTEVSEQIVAGVNYKMVFESPEGQYSITVFCQPWTNTYEIMEIRSGSLLIQ